MAYNRYQTGSSFLSVFFWLFVVIFVSCGGLFLLDFMGLYSVRPLLSSYLRWTGIGKGEDALLSSDPLLLEKERIEKRELAVMLQQQEIAKSEVDLARRQVELEQMMNELSEQQKSQNEREAQFIKQNERYMDEVANLRQNAEYLLAMQPQLAVDRLKGLEDAVLIAHLRMVEQISSETNQGSLVPLWLSMLPADQASRIIKKMQLPGAHRERS